MPKFEEVLEQHKETLGTVEGFGENYKAVSTKLQELGYDVLINQRDKAEFIPTGRLNEVAAQRDQFKTQVETLNSQLEEMKKQATGDDKKKIQELMDANTALLGQVEETKVEAEILLGAAEANNPKDVLAFVDRSKIKVNAKGEVTGVEKEIERIKEEKPYLFKEGSGRRGGTPPGGGAGGASGMNMNSLIRRAAGIK